VEGLKIQEDFIGFSVDIFQLGLEEWVCDPLDNDLGGVLVGDSLKLAHRSLKLDQGHSLLQSLPLQELMVKKKERTRKDLDTCFHQRESNTRYLHKDVNLFLDGCKIIVNQPQVQELLDRAQLSENRKAIGKANNATQALFQLDHKICGLKHQW